MKILLVNTIDRGGAAKSCIRLHLGLLNLGFNSKLLLLHKTDYSIPESYQFNYQKKYPSIIERLIAKIKRDVFGFKKLILADFLKNKPEGFEIFSEAKSLFNIQSSDLYKEADLINLHWVAGFLDYPGFFTNIDKPVIWTLHDTNAFTGGCHYTAGCEKFTTNCVDCHQLKGTIDANYSSKQLNIKVSSLVKLTRFKVITPSVWLSNEAKRSTLFKSFDVKTIPYGLDKEIFKSRNKLFSRDLLSIPMNKKVLLFVSDSIHTKRKGYHFLQQALCQLKIDDLILLTIGRKHCTIKSGNNIIELGEIKDERLMSVVYSAADVFIIPSIEDNLPNTVLESLMCGTPVIGFPIGGIPDMIEPGVNGYLCSGVSSDSLSETINEFFNNSEKFKREQISENAVKKYDLSIQAGEYKRLFTSILNQ